MKRKFVNVIGMELERWSNKGCIAYFGVEKDWATLYDIRSTNEGKGEATELLIEAKTYYESQSKKFGGSVALNDRMKKIYQRLQIVEYTE